MTLPPERASLEPGSTGSVSALSACLCMIFVSWGKQTISWAILTLSVSGLQTVSQRGGPGEIVTTDQSLWTPIRRPDHSLNLEPEGRDARQRSKTEMGKDLN